MGLLTGKSIDSKKASRNVFELTNLKSYEKDIRQLILKLNEIANNRGKTIPQVALNYIISKGVLPIAGSNSKQHLLDNLGAQSWHLNRNEMNALDSLSDEACEIRSFEGAGFKRSNEKFVGYGFESWDLK
jgi:pyridoxine 4-dehydrogenase